jgi:hypothetical protein
MFSDNSWPLELPFFAVMLLRRLRGILELPGMLGKLKLKLKRSQASSREGAQQKCNFILQAISDTKS